MNKLSIELKPCPFCGFEAAIVGIETGGFKAECQERDCGASLHGWSTLEKDEDCFEKIELIAKYWNARSTIS